MKSILSIIGRANTISECEFDLIDMITEIETNEEFCILADSLNRGY